MIDLKKHFDKENLHHAYLIEGAREEIIPELLSFLEELGIKTYGNSDFMHIGVDSFKIDDARNLKAYGAQKSFTEGKRIFIISANSFLLEAQNSLLKMFEEPIENTHFFLVVPDANSLLKTLVSRFYFISPKQGLGGEDASVAEAEKFLKMNLRDRLDFVKELLAEPEEEDEDGNEVVVLDSTKAKAIKFLNAVEENLHRGLHRGTLCKSTGFPCVRALEHMFKVRKFLRMPGSSAKSLMESVALIVPIV